MSKPCCNIHEKFQVNNYLIREYSHWTLSLRPSQTTLGSCVLISKQHAETFGALRASAFEELKTAVSDFEGPIKMALGFQKVNYLMLMMVDQHSHFHIIPRYEAPVTFEELQLTDEDWPGPPKLKSIALEGAVLKRITTHIRSGLGL